MASTSDEYLNVKRLNVTQSFHGLIFTLIASLLFFASISSTFCRPFPKASFVARSRQQLKTAVEICADQSKKFSMSSKMHTNTQMKLFNAIVAVNTLNGIGISHGVGESKSFAMPWKLKNEFRYLRLMLDHHQEKFEKQGRKNLIICGPNVFREQKKYFDQSKFWLAVVSRSLPKRPKGCDILSRDFSLQELQSLVHSQEWSSRIGNVFVLGGAPVYDTLAASAIPSRFFLTRIQSDGYADIRIKPLDEQLWRRVPTPWVTDLPVLQGAQREVDLLSGREVAYEVEVYCNVDACFGGENDSTE